MIRVTIELWPKGDASRKRTLGWIDIANDGSSDSDDIGNYKGTLYAEYTGPGGRKARVMQFHRRRQSVFSLVGAFLKQWGHTKHSPKLMKKG